MCNHLVLTTSMGHPPFMVVPIRVEIGIFFLFIHLCFNIILRNMLYVVRMLYLIYNQIKPTQLTYMVYVFSKTKGVYTKEEGLQLL